MKYALLIYTAPGSFEALPEPEQRDVHERYMTIARTDGVLGGEQLQPPETATTVRVSAGETLTTDGPFADTKEFFAGFYLLDADNLDRAIELAAQVPATWMGGSVEVRPIVEQPS
jgi:hypothetical protein